MEQQLYLDSSRKVIVETWPVHGVRLAISVPYYDEEGFIELTPAQARELAAVLLVVADTSEGK